MPRNSPTDNLDTRLRLIKLGAVLCGVLFVSRLFFLQVLTTRKFQAEASTQHEFVSELAPTRGEIIMRDKEGGEYPLATNQEVYLVYADTRAIENNVGTAGKLAQHLGIDAAEIEEIISKPDDPYEPIAKGVTDDVVDAIKKEKIKGIGFVKEQKRLYPNKEVGSHLVGFIGPDSRGTIIGRYGLEATFEKELAGEAGYIAGEKDGAGRLIPVGNRKVSEPKDGSNLILTIDQRIEAFACAKLDESVKAHDATGGSVVIMDPKTGAIRAMCGSPSFDPNDYKEVTSLNVYNNPATFNAYEPGSIFKVFTYAGAIDAGKINPDTMYEDTGVIKIDKFEIKNSDGKAHGRVSMSYALSESLNTGSIYAMRAMGVDRFKKYMTNFGFGKPTSIELPRESGGDMSNMNRPGQAYALTASFGQGITVTPMQIVAAVGSIANGGKLMKPYIVESIEENGRMRKVGVPQTVRQVISERAATLVTGMMVKVVEEGHGKRAGVPGFWLAGKTGTAQIASAKGGYEKNANIGSFVGFAPIEDPSFVMAVRIDRPQGVTFAESTAAPLFGEIAQFLLQYDEARPNRPLKK